MSERQTLLPVAVAEQKTTTRMSGLTAGVKSSDTARAISFVCAVIVGLASGSNYGYSAYAPQLATQLHLSSTQINLVGTAGNLGMYLTGPICGKIVDSRGQQIPLLFGSAFVFIGYATVHAFYVGSIPLRSNPDDPASHLGLFTLCLAMFLTGFGGSAGLSASVNAIAKSFSDKSRGSMTGAVLAGFGLSAFAFSTAGHLVFGGEAGGLLLLLAFGTGVPMFIASFLLRAVPPDSQAGYERIGSSEADAEHGAEDGYEDEAQILADENEAFQGSASTTLERTRSTSLELTRSISPAPRGRHHHVHFPTDEPDLRRSAIKHNRSSSHGSVSPLHIAMTPRDLIVSTDFWLIFAILALLCGTGLMYINNAGTVALALARGGQLEYDRKAVSGWQAKQVGTVSVWNCAGRILGGMVSDFAKTRYKLQRIWFLPVVAAGFVASQVAAQDTLDVRHLWMVSTALGLSYGSLFNVMPMLVLEWFGMANFSQNYGWTCVAPVIGGNVFNLLFGRIYDSNTVGRVGGAPEASGVGATANNVVSLAVRGLFARAGGLSDEAKHDCLLGQRCYSTAFKISTAGCVLAFGLSVVAGFRRERQKRRRSAEIAG